MHLVQGFVFAILTLLDYHTDVFDCSYDSGLKEIKR